MAVPEMYVRAARVDEVRAAGRLAVRVHGHALVLFPLGDRICAVDNRCPHMGFPLDRGTIRDGILTCHWHHARFDLSSGGTFDQFAGDVRVFSVRLVDGEVWVDVASHEDMRAHQQSRLRDGLERNIPLVIAKAVMALTNGNGDPEEPFRIGLEFGARFRRGGWGPGLTIHACMMNLWPHLEPADRARALYHGVAAVARDCDGMPPRFALDPLPNTTADIAVLSRWFRQCIEVRDAEGAERCLVSAIRSGTAGSHVAGMLFTAATDHRFLSGGHVLDFTAKAFEALDLAGWNLAEAVLPSLVGGYAAADRMEESNEWRHPVDLVALLEPAFETLPEALAAGKPRRGTWSGRERLVPVLLGDDAGAIVEGLLAAIREGATGPELSAAVAYTAALRIARFPRSNEFGDWDTALHTFTFANAVDQGMRRVESPALLRGVFDAAAAVYLDRFLNIPPARLPNAHGADPDAALAGLPGLLDRRQEMDAAGQSVADYLGAGGEPGRLVASLGHLLLREDRNFHTIQAVEAAARQFLPLAGTPAGTHVLVAAVRYLAAHAPTVRAEGQTFDIALRLARGEQVFAES